MLDFIMWPLWSAFGAYCFWFFTRAKKLEPLTLDDLVVLWKIHKQQTGCHAPISRVEPIIDGHSDEFSGFRCECGYQYASKRLIAQRAAVERNMFVSIQPNRTKHNTVLRT
jgi:hypothetical protein